MTIQRDKENAIALLEDIRSARFVEDCDGSTVDERLRASDAEMRLKRRLYRDVMRPVTPADTSDRVYEQVEYVKWMALSVTPALGDGYKEDAERYLMDVLSGLLVRAKELEDQEIEAAAEMLIGESVMGATPPPWCRPNLGKQHEWIKEILGKTYSTAAQPKPRELVEAPVVIFPSHFGQARPVPEAPAEELLTEAEAAVHRALAVRPRDDEPPGLYGAGRWS